MEQKPLSGWTYLAYNRIFRQESFTKLDAAGRGELDGRRLCRQSVGVVWVEHLEKLLASSFIIL